jgi:glycosyltransferase involved in cell wall biosynthesis
MRAPVFAFVAVTSGSFEGAIIRDMRLANELHRRGYRVVVYWVLQQNRALVDDGIPQRVLCSALRYGGTRPSALGALLGRLFDRLPAQRRIKALQTWPDLATRVARNFCNILCDGDTGDLPVIRRLARFLARDRVTHVLPTFAFAGPLVLAAKRLARHRFEYLVTFQGEELFANYAADLGRLADYYERLREVVAHSAWNSIAVSDDYAARLRDEMGIDPARLTTIFPGIEPAARAWEDRTGAFDAIRRCFPRLRPGAPIVTYVGRNDAEKGIDLLLYAANILRARGVALQLAIAGGTTFGSLYRRGCEQIAAHLRLDVHWQGRIPSAVRDALYAVSRCIVYPPIHREPFGMVAAEALSHGTPVLVPDYGGITEAIRTSGRAGGLTFRPWDSGDLAAQLQRLVTDDALHRRLAAEARPVAEQFSVRHLADHVLAHLGMARAPQHPARDDGQTAERPQSAERYSSAAWNAGRSSKRAR